VQENTGAARRRSAGETANVGAPPRARDGAVVLTAAYLYYVEGRSQDEVARQLSVSRSTVSRLLAEARQTGVVRIEVAAPPVEGLAAELADQLGLERVYLAPGVAAPDDPGPMLAKAVGEALVDSELHAGDALLVSWGRATWSVSGVELPAIPGVVVVPALGGLNDEQPWVQTNEIARRLAARLQGSVLLLHAPAVPSDTLRASLLTDESIRAALTRWDDAAVILFGIGAWAHAQPEPPSILSLDQKTLEGSAGDVVARLFDLEGKRVPYAAEDRLLGITTAQLARIRRRIAVAVGIHKVDAIIGAARSGLIDVLVTDVITASALAARFGATETREG
jgi:DNA-binding transcriptional regulator LsrR (DeoR family)